MNTSEAHGPAGPATVALGSTVTALRRHRQLLLAEQRRCVHLRRLLRARLDLTIAETMELPATGCPLTGSARPGRRAEVAPPNLEVLLLAAGACAPTDIVSRLVDLETAVRRLSAYTDALTTDIDDVTILYVEALAADPASCLALMADVGCPEGRDAGVQRGTVAPRAGVNHAAR